MHGPRDELDPNPSASPPADEVLRAWLALAHVPGLGSIGAQRLLEHCDDPTQIGKLSDNELAACGIASAVRKHLRDPDWTGVDTDLAWREHPNRHILTWTDARYPPRLRDLPDAPLVLYVVGNPQVLSAEQLAIVGSRNPSSGGERTAREFARHLAASGLVITSGLAAGIDAAGHQGALDAQGATVAVLGTGPDLVYPAAHRQLATAIAATGALVTEFPPGSPPRAEHFPRRNRIISGLCLGVLVVEAAVRSGSLITARLALEQGREVFAIPGSIHNPLARGCHALIRQGAKLVETAADIIDELLPITRERLQIPTDDAADGAPTLDAEYQQLLEYMGFEAISVDELVSVSGLTPEAVSSMLLILELQGVVAASPGGRYCRLPHEGPR